MVTLKNLSNEVLANANKLTHSQMSEITGGKTFNCAAGGQHVGFYSANSAKEAEAAVQKYYPGDSIMCYEV